MKAKNWLTGLVLGAVATAVLTATAAPALAQDKATLRLNWILGGLHTPFYLGVERGYYADEGIDLTINEGRGSGVAMQIIAAKDDTFGMSDAGSLMLGVSKGQKVQAVMSLLNTSGFGIISLAEAGIASPKDLEGKTLALSPGDALTQLFPAVIAANNLDEDAIRLVFMDPSAKPVAVMEKRTDALLGGIDDQIFLIEARGFEASALRFADIGVNTVGITVHTHEDTLRDNPDLVRRFVKASQRSWQAAIEDPQAAIAAAQNIKPDLNADAMLKQLRVDLDLLSSPNTEGKGIGFGAAEDWELTKTLLTQYRDLQTDRAATSFFTNEFLQ